MTTTSTRSQRRAERLDDPRLESWRTPRARRRLVAGMTALLVVEAGILAVMPSAPVPAVIGLAVVAFAFVLCLGALKGSTRGVEELPKEALDERQWQVRGEAYARAYKIGAGLLTAALAVITVWLAADWPAPGPGVVTAAVVVTFHVAIVLPTMVTASSRTV